MRRWQIKDWGEALVEQVIAFETARKEKVESKAAEGPRKRKRKRRGSGRGRNEAGEQEAGKHPDKRVSEPSEGA